MLKLKNDLEQLSVEYKRTLGNARTRADVDAFVESKIVEKMRVHGDILYEIEQFRLPEVIALICNSDPLLLKDKYDKYVNIAPLYSSDKEDILHDVLELDVKIFEKTVIPYLDGFLIDKIKKYKKGLDDAVDEKEQALRNCKENLRKKKNQIKKEEKKQGGNQKKIEELTEHGKTTNVTIAENSKESVENLNNIEQLKKDVEDIRNRVEKLKKEQRELEIEKEKLEALIDEKYEKIDSVEPCCDLVMDYEKRYFEESRLRRRACYDAIETIGYKNETKIIDMLLQGGEIDEIVKMFEKSDNAAENIIELLNSGKYPSKKMSIVAAMLKVGAIDENCRYLHQFLLTNATLLQEYLLSNCKKNTAELKIDKAYGLLFDFVIDQEIRIETIQYSALWEELENSDMWKYVCTRIDNEITLSKIVSPIRGCVLRSFLKCLDECDINLPKLAQALARQKEVNSDLIFRIVQIYDKKLARANKEIRRANKRMEIQENAESEKVFSAMYKPMEKLEMLTYDIKKYDGEIEKKIIVNQMMECVSKFRDALTDLGIQPMEEFDNWKMQKCIDYDSCKHRYEDGNSKNSVLVNVKTMGYRYNTADSCENTEHLEYAKVVAVKG